MEQSCRQRVRHHRRCRRHRSRRDYGEDLVEDKRERARAGSAKSLVADDAALADDLTNEEPAGNLGADETVDESSLAGHVAEFAELGGVTNDLRHTAHDGDWVWHELDLGKIGMSRGVNDKVAQKFLSEGGHDQVLPSVSST